MCGRYTIFTEDELVEIRSIIQEVSKKFGDGAVKTGEIFPTNIAPVLTLDSNRLVPSAVTWGFPKWDGKGVIINARSESALQKPMFSKPLLNRRCVIPSTGFYEWAFESVVNPQISFLPVERQHSPKEQKIKLHFRCLDTPMLYMAGMINTFTDKDGKRKDVFVILTTEANSSMSPFHDRMPVILMPDECGSFIKNDSFMKEVLVRDGPVFEWKIA